MVKKGFTIARGMLIVAVFIFALIVLSLLFPEMSLRAPSLSDFNAENLFLAVLHFIFNIIKDFIDKII